MRRAMILGPMMGLCWAMGCTPSLPAPSRLGPAPEYVEPTGSAHDEPADDAARPDNPEFAAQLGELMQGAGFEALDRCKREEETAKGAQVLGAVTMHLVLAPDGRLVASEPRNGVGLSEPLIQCLAGALAPLSFPAPGGERNLPVQLPLQFGGHAAEGSH